MISEILSFTSTHPSHRDDRHLRFVSFASTSMVPTSTVYRLLDATSTAPTTLLSLSPTCALPPGLFAAPTNFSRSLGFDSFLQLFPFSRGGSLLRISSMADDSSPVGACFPLRGVPSTVKRVDAKTRDTLPF